MVSGARWQPIGVRVALHLKGIQVREIALRSLRAPAAFCMLARFFR
jgi:hypothetical protein